METTACLQVCGKSTKTNESMNLIETTPWIWVCVFSFIHSRKQFKGKKKEKKKSQLLAAPMKPKRI